MTTVLERSPSSPLPTTPPTSPTPPTPIPPLAPRRPPRTRHWLERYRSHLLIGGLSVIVTAVAMSPLVLGSMSRSSVTRVAVAPANLSTQVGMTATEFKFNPTSVQVPVGAKIAFTLDNQGVVEHDVTIPSAGFTLLAKAGQRVSGDVTFNTPGVFEFLCSIPGHRDAGMKGSLTVVDPAATAPVAQPAAVQSGMPRVPGSTASAPDIQPLPANVTPLPAPRIAPPIERTEPANVKFDLTTQKVTATLADGVAYDYWTFDGSVPGPMLRVREGDTVDITLHNAADAGVTHSIDLHAVTGPGGGAKVMQIPPGEDGSFTFKALDPGVYVYHCATPMVAHHIASGTYGLIVVEPRAGLPKVDHEFYVMQGDFYLQGQRGDTGLRAFDLTRMLSEQPDYVLFNGRVGSLSGDNALHARVGDTLRLFFGVGGPNLTSSFHVIGAVFDRVFPEGSLTSPPQTHVQTTHVSTGGATMVEFTARVPGTYSMVDHSLGRMEKGAAGQIVVEGPGNADVFQPIRPGRGGESGH